MFDRIVLHPYPETGKLTLELEGALAGLLTLAAPNDFHNAPKQVSGASPKIQDFDVIEELVLVAGA
ncbi:MAG: hypothetical protein GY883_13430 [Shimia sp.]|nr:hypothetical protein [Shimia sp.]